MSSIEVITAVVAGCVAVSGGLLVVVADVLVVVRKGRGRLEEEGRRCQGSTRLLPRAGKQGLSSDCSHPVQEPFAWSVPVNSGNLAAQKAGVCSYPEEARSGDNLLFFSALAMQIRCLSLKRKRVLFRERGKKMRAFVCLSGEQSCEALLRIP